MKLKLFLLITLAIVFNFALAKKNQFIQIQANKTLALLAFVETAKGSSGSSHSFKKYIDKKLGKSKEFKDLIKRYHELNLSYQLELKGYPDSRHTYTNTKDFIWTAASNATDLDDLSQRIIGYLPYEDHLEFISILKQFEPFYDELIWHKTKKQRKRIIKQLTAYTDKIEELFLTISHFLGSSWSKQTPFKVMLYPIPLKQGHTTAIPKGNALIVGFLTENKQDYINRLGIIIHEMVHILYGAQPVELQNDMDKWFMQSQSDYSKLAYNYINEALATAIGNGWSYQQINGKMDTEEWYDNEYINGFAHEIYPSVTQYLDANKTIDKAFVQNSIASFGKTFPRAIDNTNILLNDFYLFANSEIESDNSFIQDSNIFNYFNIRSFRLYTPINEAESYEYMATERTTKLIVIAKNNQETLNSLTKHLTTIPKELDSNTDFIYSYKDKPSKSTIIIINIQSIEKLEQAIKTLSKEKYLKLGLQVIK
jgi:hypothetical protein